MRLIILLLIIMCASLLQATVNAAKYGDWDFRISTEGAKRASIFTTEKNSGQYPLLIIECLENYSEEDGFDLVLYSEKNFKPTQHELVISVNSKIDNEPPMNTQWGAEGKVLFKTKSRWLIKDMLQGEQFILKFDEKDGRKNYEYSLHGLKEAIVSAEKFCGIKFTGNQK